VIGVTLRGFYIARGAALSMFSAGNADQHVVGQRETKLIEERALQSRTRNYNSHPI
jgi:hypothetical protein